VARRGVRPDGVPRRRAARRYVSGRSAPPRRGQPTLDLYGPGCSAQAQHEPAVRLGAADVTYANAGPVPARGDLGEALQHRSHAGQQHGLRGQPPGRRPRAPVIAAFPYVDHRPGLTRQRRVLDLAPRHLSLRAPRIASPQYLRRASASRRGRPPPPLGRTLGVAGPGATPTDPGDRGRTGPPTPGPIRRTRVRLQTDLAQSRNDARLTAAS
jgi:hypothetical protein